MPARPSVRPTHRRRRPTRTIKRKPATVLERLTAEESTKVLATLLSRHQALRAEAEQIATELVSMPAVDQVAHDVVGSLTDIDCDAVSSRAADQRWGQVAPTEAAWELLQQALGDVIRDMQRRMDLGLVDAAEAICRGIVVGLYRAQGSGADGALGWAPDFPSKQASRAVAELLQACPADRKRATRERLLAALSDEAPDWREMLVRAAAPERPAR